MSERMKPPARRTGRTLGGAKKATPPPPPPTAELTPEQFAAEQAAAQGEGTRAASEPAVQAAPPTVTVERSAQGRTETVTEVAQISAQPTAEAPSSPVPEPAASQPVRPAVDVPEAGTESAGEPAERQVPPVVPPPEHAAPAIQPTQQAEPDAQHGPSPVTSAASGPAPAAEVAVRPAVPPVGGGTAFPVRTEGAGAHQEQDARSQEAPSEGAPYAHGPGRPKDVPEVAVVLNQRIIARESLDSSVPSVLKLKKRIKRFALDNELDHLPIGDIVSVALDEWLTARGF
ncbi:hypothetical protein PV387_04640 [Streptomyces sp. ME02-6987-2C]|uniref:hypothetical protein n=1 Tax=unclassified Streptomyces TaxID=2593676 RepID=UPI0008792AD0|nr:MULTISPECIES: hypothetical protein [unclassified Streptomyces]MDX3365319.1 hypothetical protein [Streptomyces sp. ME02-6987-2C]MDX3422684.1 hypothetical protein [Streptomyces sp. ME02-6985-2c]REH20577.1 hypothetical protein BX268_2358 [Streptomyces sp. 2221.1]SDT29049.1 hypothetical protein SAMN05428941_2353 [Streptomyces sp. 2114.2]